MKTLYVGDPHAEVSSLPEMERLITYIEQIIKKEPINMIVFLGDQYHTHSVIHSPVMAFWEKSFARLCSQCHCMALVGNHDKPVNSDSTTNSMMLHNDIHIVDDFWRFASRSTDILYVAHQNSAQRFIEICNQNPTNLVVAHQTFYGSTYENGFYAPEKDSIDPNLIPQKQIISGHIHRPQKFGKVWYPGSPRWRTTSDANTERAIWVVEHDCDGMIKSTKSWPTSGICTPIFVFDDTEVAPVNVNELPANSKITINLHGSLEYINRRKIILENMGCKIRTFPTKNWNSDIRESEGIQKSFVKFTQTFKSKYNTPANRLLELSERIKWT